MGAREAAQGLWEPTAPTDLNVGVVNPVGARPATGFPGQREEASAGA
jgi:hypothetical protein